MRCHLDHPAVETVCDPAGFYVEGWLHGGPAHSELQYVEAYAGKFLLGRTHYLIEREDVARTENLSAGVRTGFQFLCRFENLPVASEIMLEIRARFRGRAIAVHVMARPVKFGPNADNAENRPPAGRRLFTHEEKVDRWLRPLAVTTRSRDFGVEIGAFRTPVPGIRPFYVDRFKDFTRAKVRCLADYWGDATDLPFHDHSLDYVVSSHVLEHVANPVAAIFEWARVLRHGGLVYLVVPDRRLTFDHRRELTTAEHMIADFCAGTTYCDATHLVDYLDGIDLMRWNPSATLDENVAERERLRAAYLAALAAGEEINIHFHTFEVSNLTALVEEMNRLPQRPGKFEVVDRAEYFPAHNPTGVLVVLRVTKPLQARAAGAFLRLAADDLAEAALGPGAKKFEA